MKDIIGKRFGKLTVLEFAGRKIIKNKYRYFYKCKCDCGNIIIRNADNLKTDVMSSCGCFKSGTLNKKHGLWKYGFRLYGVWQAMKGRCLRPTNQKFKDYGGRGIKICKEWITDFKAFYEWANNTGYKEGLTLERIDVNGNYEPANCKWIPPEEQARNKRNNVFIEYNGETHCLREWARILKLNYKTIHKRIKDGWDVQKALSTPIANK